MKWACVLILCMGMVVTRAADTVVQTNAIVTETGDSQWNDTSGTSPITGFRTPDYIDAGMKLLFPYKNIRVFNYSQSGVIPDRMLTNNVPQEIGLWGYQSNTFQHVGILMPTDNGAYTSNQMYFNHSNTFQAPLWLSSGDLNLVQNSGWCAANTVDWLGIGSPPVESANGDPLTEGARNNASTNAGWRLGVRGVDSFNILSNSFAVDFAANVGTNVQWAGAPKGGHYLNGGALAWALTFLAQAFPSKTNVTSCVIDWNGAIVTTNNCVVSNVVIGTSLTFDEVEFSLPPPWDHAGDIVADGTITNTADLCFNLDPMFGNMFNQLLQITNLPTGNWCVKEDGEIIATISSSVLGVRWNKFRCTTGPTWRKRVDVLAKCRTKEHVNQVTLIAGSAGDQQGMVYFGSNATAQWEANKRGDAFIAAVDSFAANVFALDATENAAAQPVVRHMEIVPVTSYPAPFR